LILTFCYFNSFFVFVCPGTDSFSSCQEPACLLFRRIQYFMYIREGERVRWKYKHRRNSKTLMIQVGTTKALWDTGHWFFCLISPWRPYFWNIGLWDRPCFAFCRSFVRSFFVFSFDLCYLVIMEIAVPIDLYCLVAVGIFAFFCWMYVSHFYTITDIGGRLVYVNAMALLR